jgi:hypothetical protein
MTKDQKHTKGLGKLRKLARERVNKLAPKMKAPPLIAIEPEDVAFLDKFTYETAFYIEELENKIGEELTDYWESRENAMRILTDLMIQDEENHR